LHEEKNIDCGSSRKGLKKAFGRVAAYGGGVYRLLLGENRWKETTLKT
jgi:hypothetical protein